mmetsp:Transcript_11710/g.17590  ORF Transcript_11710/g.17590 Transcript_11710/m.17590 type:complete len:127 (+) Transcript_11710:6-386(+)
MQDSIQNNFAAAMSEEERDQLVRTVLTNAVPPLIIQQIGIDGILRSVPPNYIGAIVGAWVASRFVYKHGINASEVSFFCFMRSLLNGNGSTKAEVVAEDGNPSEERQLKRKASNDIESMTIKSRRG